MTDNKNKTVELKNELSQTERGAETQVALFAQLKDPSAIVFDYLRTLGAHCCLFIHEPR
jgi:hypothetical protein